MFSCKGRKKKRRFVFTIGLIYENGQILLVYKKFGKFGVGKWNGPGGLVEEGESVEECCCREFLEETSSTPEAKDGILVKKLKEVGLAEFEFQSMPGQIRECHIFKILGYSGKAKENYQMTPVWFRFEDIPFNSNKIWRSDEIWLRLLLAGKKFRGWFLYDNPENGRLLEYRLKTVK